MPRLFSPAGLDIPTVNNKAALKVSVSSGFTPADISSLELWLKADAGTSTTVDGAEVTTWSDQSGNGLDFTAAAGTGPLYKTAIVNGKPVLRFAGTDEFMAAGSSTTIKHIFVVVYLDDEVFSAYDGVFTGAVNVDSNIVLVGEVATSRFYDEPATTTSYHKNGVSIAENDMLAPLQTWGVVSLSAATGWADPLTPQVGRDRTITDRHLDGDIAEVIAYSSVLSTADRQSVEAYLMGKYGVS